MLKAMHGIIASGGNVATPWDLVNAAYNSVSFAHTVGGVYGVFFRPDGLRMYIITFATVYQFTLSVAWDLSTATTAGMLSFSVAGQDSFPHDLFFKSDGTAMYVTGAQNNRVYQYVLGTAWDLSTATAVGLITSPVYSQASFPSGLFIKSDGTKLYKTSGGSVYQYSFGVAWDISTITYDSVTFNAADSPEAVFFKPDGLRIFTLPPSGSVIGVRQYDLGTAWDLSTASLIPTLAFDMSGQEGDPRGMFFKPDGLRIYMGGTFTIPRNIYQYDL